MSTTKVYLFKLPIVEVYVCSIEISQRICRFESNSSLIVTHGTGNVFLKLYICTSKTCGGSFYYMTVSCCHSRLKQLTVLFVFQAPEVVLRLAMFIVSPTHSRAVTKHGLQQCDIAGRLIHSVRRAAAPSDGRLRGCGLYP